MFAILIAAHFNVSYALKEANDYVMRNLTIVQCLHEVNTSGNDNKYITSFCCASLSRINVFIHNLLSN
jgi:hypothetical protein